MFKKTGYDILHIILLIIIILNILEFFELLNPFFDFVKKIISWTLIVMVFYKLQPSKILLGVRNKLWDFGFITAGLLLVVDGLVRYANIMRESLLNNIGLYYDWFVASGEGLVISVNETVFNQIQLSTGVGVAQHMRELASNLTLLQNQVLVTFENAVGEQITYLLAANNASGTLLPLFNTIITHASAIQQWSLILAVCTVMLLGLFATLRIPTEQKSVIGLFDIGVAHGLKRIIIRFFSVTILAMTFLLFVFAPVVEWLAIAVDAPILMVALLVSLALLLFHKARFSFAQWEEWVTEFGSNIKPYVDLFCNKKTILLGVSGILVLHLLIEIFTYILPFVLPVTSQLYIAQLSSEYSNLFVLVDSVWWYPLVLINVFAWTCVFAIPAYIWYKIYQLKTGGHGHPSFSPGFLGVFYASVVVALLSQMIWFRRLQEEGLIGVDFFVQTPSGDPVVLLLLFVGVFTIVYFFAQFEIKKYLYLLPVFLPLTFMGVYTWLFFESAFTYYLSVSLSAFVAGWYFLAAVFLLFLVLSALFYISAYMFFVYEVIKEEH